MKTRDKSRLVSLARMLSASVLRLSLLLTALPPSSGSAAYFASSIAERSAAVAAAAKSNASFACGATLLVPAQAESVMVVHHEPVEGMDVQEYPQKSGTPIIKCGRLNNAPKVFFSFRRNTKG